MGIMRLKSCGRKGRLARGFIGDLVQGRGAEWRQAQRALLHVEECLYCRVSIESAINGAKKEGHRTDYLDSYQETLKAAWERFGVVSGVGKERNL